MRVIHAIVVAAALALSACGGSSGATGVCKDAIDAMKACGADPKAPDKCEGQAKTFAECIIMDKTKACDLATNSMCIALSTSGSP
ncbi:MAG: hypothetical protein U1E65_30080 [Myxococcota bacterium]